VYRHRFGRAQKCWAHLLRKAIKLALLYPRKKSYQRFLDRLLALYYDAKRAAADRRLIVLKRQCELVSHCFFNKRRCRRFVAVFNVELDYTSHQGRPVCLFQSEPVMFEDRPILINSVGLLSCLP
jgi:hypothetical protein